MMQASVPVHRLRADRRAIPDATVARLPLYLRVLSDMADKGVTTVSSEDLAVNAGVTSAKVRKDLSQLGSGEDDIDKQLRELTSGAQVDDELAKMKAELGSGGGDAPALEQGEEKA